MTAPQFASLSDMAVLPEVDVVMNAVVGEVGLEPSLAGAGCR